MLRWQCQRVCSMERIRQKHQAWNGNVFTNAMIYFDLIGIHESESHMELLMEWSDTRGRIKLYFIGMSTS